VGRKIVLLPSSFTSKTAARQHLNGRKGKVGSLSKYDQCRAFTDGGAAKIANTDDRRWCGCRARYFHCLKQRFWRWLIATIIQAAADPDYSPLLALNGDYLIYRTIYEPTKCRVEQENPPHLIRRTPDFGQSQDPLLLKFMVDVTCTLPHPHGATGTGQLPEGSGLRACLPSAMQPSSNGQ